MAEMNSDFTGRVAIVTGGASGIGERIAHDLVRAGASVMVADRNAEGAEAVARTLQESAGLAEWLETDVSQHDDASRLAERTFAAFGRIDILVHSAGIGVESSFLDTTPEQWKTIIDIDLSGTFYCAQAVARYMVRSGYGRIITLSSTAGLRGGTGRAAYGAAKGGVAALTKVMAVELADYGITANALAPGAIETALVKRMHSEETRHVYRAGIPMDRYGTPQEVSSAALFLASEEARYITGHVLVVDGGFLAAGVLHRKKA